MANELQVTFEQGKTLYAVIYNQTSGMPWSTSGAGGFSAFVSGAWPEYAISLTEQGVSSFYAGNMPSAIPAGLYSVQAREQIGGGALQTDPPVGDGNVNWDGSKMVPISDLVTSGQLSEFYPTRLARGEMIQNFPINLVSSLDHSTPITSGTISGQISRDGGSFGPLQSGAFTEIGLGWYKLQALTSGDLLANTVALHFTAFKSGGGNSDPLNMSIVLQRTSGQ